MNINRIIITGKLVANLSLRETNAGTPVAFATIANNEFLNDDQGERQQITSFAQFGVSLVKTSLLWLRKVRRSSLTRRYQDSLDLPVHPFSAADQDSHRAAGRGIARDAP